MLGRDARSGVSQGSQTTSTGRSAAEREREQRMQQLAAWRRQKEQQQRENQAKTTPTKSGKPKQPFNTTMATSAQSDAEKQRLLQRRKELMRPPSTKKSAQQPAKDTPLQRQEKATTSTTATATALSEDMTITSAAPARASQKLSLLRDTLVAGAHATAAPPSPAQVDADELKRSVSGDVRVPSVHRDQAPLEAANQVPLVEDAPASPHPERPQFELSAPPATTTEHRVPALYAPRPLPPRVVRLPDALNIDKRPPVRSPASSPPVNLAAPTTPPPLSPDVETSPVGSPGSASDPTSSVLKIQLSSSKGAKQVRFADEVHGSPEQGATGAVELQAELGSAPRHDGDERLDEDDEPRNLLMDSQSSVDREIQQTEVLMGEVDELLSFHKTETIVTDHFVHLHRDAEGHEETEEAVVETRTEEMSLVHIEEETVVQAPAMSMNQPPSATDNDAGSLFAPSPAKPNDHMSKPPTGPPVAPSPTQKLYVARPPIASTTGDVSLPAEPPAVHREQGTTHATPTVNPSRRQKLNWRKITELSLVVIGFFLVDLFFPWSPVSKGIRVAIRVVTAATTYLTSRVANWMWSNVLQPTTETACTKLADANALWSPSARALQSLVHEGFVGFSSMFRRDASGAKLSISQYGYAIFHGISSGVADAILYVARPLLKPLPTIDSATTAAVEQRLEELNDAQQQLPVAVKEILRTHEEWALEELARMKHRRVAYATATQSLLQETSKTMLEAVRDAKVIAAEHIQAFTNQLASELMASIKPELEAYEQSQADISREDAQLEADLKKDKLEAAARLEILRVEVAKKQATTKLGEDVATAQDELAAEVIAEEVDVVEVVEAAEDLIGDDAVRAIEEIAAGFEATIEEAEVLAKKKETEADIMIEAKEREIKVVKDQVLDRLQKDVATRREELKHKHDALKGEIQRAASAKVEILEDEIRAAEELARESLLAEESLLQEAVEAQRALDELLMEDAETLERELIAAAEAATEIEVVEIEQIVVEAELAKKMLETQVEEVEKLDDMIDETENEIVESVGIVEAQLDELESVAEVAMETIATQEMEQQEAERVQAEAAIESVAAQVEQAISSSAGVDNVSDLLSRESDAKGVRPSVKPSDTTQKIYDETEFRHMVLLSVGFTALAIVTAFVLYPRWRRLAVIPSKDAKQWIVDRRGRRRRRSWQRPAEVSDSEPEEVLLLQTGSSSDDDLSESNEPEPEVVKFMSPERTRTSYTSHAHHAEENALIEVPRVRAEEEQESDTPQRRGSRRRTPRAL